MLDAERSAVRDAASGAQLKSASRGMRSSVGRAHDRAMTTISEGFDQSITLLSEGAQSYREGIGVRLDEAYDSLSIPGRTSIWTCVHYQIREQLGAQFGNSGALFQTLQSVETQFSDALLEVYTAHSERLDELLGQGKGNADSAYRSGRNEVNSYEKSALKALDKTETTVFAQIEAATQSANGRLEGVEQQQTAALDTAEQQTTADAENFKTSTEAALWAGRPCRAMPWWPPHRLPQPLGRQAQTKPSMPHSMRSTPFPSTSPPGRTRPSRWSTHGPPPK